MHIWPKSWRLVLPKGTSMQKIEVEIQKKMHQPNGQWSTVEVAAEGILVEDQIQQCWNSGKVRCFWKNNASRHILGWTFVTRKRLTNLKKIFEKKEWIRLLTGQKNKKKTGLHWQQFCLLKKSERPAVIWNSKWSWAREGGKELKDKRGRELIVELW